MPLQNRVNPKGEIVVSNSRGRLMGNRGCLHDSAQRIVRFTETPRWISCVLDLDPKFGKRPLMSGTSYTVLFFLDEATALAAGHRPCSSCRNKRYKEFTVLWAEVHNLDKYDRAEVMDKALHAERIDADRGKVTFSESIDALPNGTCIEFGDAWHLVWGDRLLRWSFEGYSGVQARPHGIEVTVLTPRSIVAVLRAGYVPELHPTAELWL